MTEPLRRRSSLAWETPLRELLRDRTPNASFFVRDHARTVPRIAEAEYRLVVAGANGEQVLTLADLRAMPRVSRVVTLACSGNGRSGFEPRPPGVPWGFGAISTAEWEGVRLRDVLERAGIGERDAHVVCDGYDEAPDAERPPFRRSLPLERALGEGTILADTMNAEPLPAEHGGPVRLLVGGWSANHSVKWLRRIALSERPDEGHWMTADYRVPDRVTGEMRTIEAAAPMAIIAAPESGAVCGHEVDVQGVAYGQPAPALVRVEVDGAHAGDVVVRYEDGPYAWGRWSLPLELRPGPHRIAVRPVDRQGNAGPEQPTWNSGGYCYDGPHAIRVEVGTAR
ncbi:MAG TPA: molybdopterin-dependent oxidoreductase [Candidatus Limnocylindrales bacterium]|nr:molybdopterin-dependent oxidoreductase [Candidatus Limnocylindrales bacterium]